MIRRLTNVLGRGRSGRRAPVCEVHVPISPTPVFLLRVRMLAASLARFSGLDCRIVATVSRDVEPYDLEAAEPWSRQAGVEWRWLDQGLWDRHGYYGTAMARFLYDFEAPFVVQLDADVLCTGRLDDLPAQAGDGIAGVMAWVSPLLSPLAYRDGVERAEERLWPDLFAAVGLPLPPLDHEHPGGRGHAPARRWAPPYFNLGVLAGTPEAMRAIGSVAFEEMARVDRFVDTRFRCQLAVTVAALRTGTPLVALPLRFNFPNSPWFWDEWPAERDDVRILHYVETDEIDREALASVPDLEAIAARAGLSPPNALLRDRLADVLPTLRT